ncbi:hypothetical protein LCGC14_2199230 [marine sediment metagenome]|uniref:HTH luxR-type domain-containing protein n=1 Tax=marine sediment metagenome TaxID=412755 RepID=A0A0F9E4C6_9ZZZZ
MKDLTPGEMEVLKFIAEGRPHKEIGALLFYAPESIKNMMKSVKKKLGAKSVAHAVHIAHQRGLLD